MGGLGAASDSQTETQAQATCCVSGVTFDAGGLHHGSSERGGGRRRVLASLADRAVQVCDIACAPPGATAAYGAEHRPPHKELVCSRPWPPHPSLPPTKT